MKSILIFIFCFCFAGNIFAQADEFGWIDSPSIGVVGGYTGLSPNMFEFGIGYQPWEVEGQFVSRPFAGLLALGEFSPDRKLYGASINAWYLAGFFSCGLSFNEHTDITNTTYGIKAMIGISCYRFGIMYGYNFFVNTNNIPDLAQNTITIKYYFPLFKNKEHGWKYKPGHD